MQERQTHVSIKSSCRLFSEISVRERVTDLTNRKRDNPGDYNFLLDVKSSVNKTSINEVPKSFGFVFLSRITQMFMIQRT